MKYTEFLQSSPLPLENNCAFAFPKIQNIFGRHFWDLFELRRRSHFDGIDVRKMGSVQNRFNLREEKKVTRCQIREIWGGVPKLQCFFLQETDEYSGLCEQEHYRDAAPMRELSKSSASCHALILRGTPFTAFLQSPQGDDSSLAATALLAKLDKKRRDPWSEAVWSIDFSHSSRKAWSILNNLTGRSRHSPRHCPVSADAIASQLVRNGKYEAVDRKSSRLVFQEVSDLWRATTPDTVNISDNFSQREFAAALQHLKPGKAPGPDSICPELILHAGAALKS